MSSKKRLVSLFPNFKNVEPLTDGQRDTIDAYTEGYNLLLHGVAGTGKTYISLGLAIRDVLDKMYSKLLIVRSYVTARDPGFLPGTLEEKVAPIEASYIAQVNKLVGAGDAYKVLKEKNLVEFKLTSFLRSTTIDNCVILVDEIQNMSFQELDTVITRIGTNSRLILCGDIHQNDLNKSKYDVSGLPKFIEIIKEMESFDSVEFEIEDIVRSGLVKEYIKTKYRLGIG